jgi:predicted kinase
MVEATQCRHHPEGFMSDIIANLQARLVVDADPRAHVVVLRGLPASGKSTIAKKAVASAPGSIVRLNNDDLNVMLCGKPYGNFDKNHSKLLKALRVNLLQTFLAQPHIRLVIVDNTNLSEHTVRELEQVAAEAGARFTVDDTLLSVDAATCIARDAARTPNVGPEVIRRMARDAAKLAPWVYLTDPLAGATPYANDPELPSAVIVDIDGTLARMENRGPFDWKAVGSDTPIRAVVDLVKDLIAAGEHIIVMSGRDGSCRAETQTWLDQHVAPGLPLHMRTAGDTRKDSIIKYELFNEHIAGKHYVRFILDDRDQVVHVWRRILQMPTFQVADGNF